MATHKSSEKRHRQSLVARARNMAARASLRTAIKIARTKIASKEASTVELRKAESALAKAASKGLIHPRTAARSISRLAAAAKKAK